MANQQIKAGDYITTTIYGRAQRVIILRVHPFGTFDVQLSNGNCYRVTGLSF